MDWTLSQDAAISNIALFGDTDVFPFPLENRLFSDRKKESAVLLANFHGGFQKYLAAYPPVTEEALCQVGYAGFRWVTQIEPFWNAYFLGLVISLADRIEAKRVPESSEAVFSYRFGWDPVTQKMFRDVGWRDYRRRSQELANQSGVVVQTDISDFYQRIYHHRIDNALARLGEPGDTPRRIIELLQAFQKNVSYGLPVGGNASRVLAELALADADKALIIKKVKFCRFVDDYTIFCANQREAYSALVILSDLLHLEGLSLNKRKTRIISSKDFLTTLSELDAADLKDPAKSDEQRLLSIAIRYDPYSPTAEEDYHQLKEAVESVDLVGILRRELGKTAIDETIVRHALRALRALNEDERLGALRTLLAEENLPTLSPVFGVLMRTVRDIYPELTPSEAETLDQQLLSIFHQQDHLLSVALNMAFYCEAIGAGSPTNEKEQVLQEIWDKARNSLCRRVVLAIMAKWKSHYFLTKVKSDFSALGRWERSVFIASSYVLGDEGRHWRNAMSFSETEVLLRDWASDRIQRGQPIPW
jgi:hypothetical protein